MAGVNFMALADGMMLGDKLNKEDDTYWRKQAQEDRKAQYDERDQAYKEKVQGYGLNTLEDYQQKVEGNRLVSQANDVIAKAAQAQGKSVADVLLESPEFTVPGASADMQSHVSSNIRSGIVAETARRLRVNGDWAKAEALETKYGIAQTSNTVNTAKLYSDVPAGNDYVTKVFPGATVNPDGSFQIGGQRMSREIALFTALRPNGMPQTAINNGLQNDKTARDAVVQQQAQATFEAAKKKGEYDVVRTLIAAGHPRSVMSPEQQQVYDAMVTQGYKPAESAATTTDPNSVGSLTSMPPGPVTPGVSPTGNHGDWRTDPAVAAAPAMPVRQSDVPMAAMPVRQSDVPTAAMPSSTSTLLSDFKASNVKLEKAKSAVEEAQRDINLLERAKNKGHFDPETLARSRATLEAAAANYQQVNLKHYATSQAWRAAVAAEENRYNASNIPSAARSDRPAYMDALERKYR